MSVRNEIMTIIESSMSNISIANGYNTDVDIVDVWRITPFSDNKTAINIMDMDDDIQSDNEGVWHFHILHFQIDIQKPGGEIYDFITDIYDSLRANVSFDNKRLKLRPEGDGFDIEQDKTKIAMATIMINVQFTTPAFEQIIMN